MAVYGRVICSRSSLQYLGVKSLLQVTHVMILLRVDFIIREMDRQVVNVETIGAKSDM
jgi:hypothetical protein